LVLMAASSASVVASVVSTVSLNGNAVIAVAPAMVSLDGGAAALAGIALTRTMAVVAVSRPSSLPDLASNVVSKGIPFPSCGRVPRPRDPPVKTCHQRPALSPFRHPPNVNMGISGSGWPGLQSCGDGPPPGEIKEVQPSSLLDRRAAGSSHHSDDIPCVHSDGRKEPL
jgi:hypothetical protein